MDAVAVGLVLAIATHGEHVIDRGDCPEFHIHPIGFKVFGDGTCKGTANRKLVRGPTTVPANAGVDTDGTVLAADLLDIEEASRVASEVSGNVNATSIQLLVHK